MIDQTGNRQYAGRFGKQRAAKKVAYQKSGGRKELQALYGARFAHKQRNPGVPMPKHLQLPQEKAATAGAA